MLVQDRLRQKTTTQVPRSAPTAESEPLEHRHQNICHLLKIDSIILYPQDITVSVLSFDGGAVLSVEGCEPCLLPCLLCNATLNSPTCHEKDRDSRS